MLKFLLEILEIVIVLKISYKLLKYFLFRKKSTKSKRKGLSITGKIWVLISRRVHYKLNQMLKTQKESLASANTEIQDPSNTKVVNIRKYKSKNAN